MNRKCEQITQDSSIRKAFGERVKQLRKVKGWTQKELGNKIGVSYAQVNTYEGGTNAPPLDKLQPMASALETSIDFLVRGNLIVDVPIHYARVIQRFQEQESFSYNPDDQEMVIKLNDARIAKQRIAPALAPVDTPQ